MKPKPKCPEGCIFDKKLGVCRPVQNDIEWLQAKFDREGIEWKTLRNL